MPVVSVSAYVHMFYHLFSVRFIFHISVAYIWVKYSSALIHDDVTEPKIKTVARNREEISAFLSRRLTR